MRVLTWNIQGCRAGIDRVAAVLRAADPEVAMLSEVARGQERALASALGCFPVKGATLRWRGFGNALLVRERPTAVRRVRFPRARGRERRGVVIASLRSGGTLAATHLGLDGTERLAHARPLLAALEGYDRVILGGDMNEQPGGPAVALLLERFTDAFAAAGEGSGETIPADAPSRRIDYLLCTRDLTPRRAAVMPTVASDHLAVVAEID